MKDICKKIKRAMQDSNLTQAQLAKKLGVNQQTISKWTTGLLNPKLSTIEKIAKQTKNLYLILLTTVQSHIRI
jgi:transcriptional regulator with XRE-family HTH domain